MSRYKVILNSHSGAVIRAIFATSADLSRITQQVRDGEGLLRLPEDDEDNYRLIPARSVGWLDVSKVSDQ